ncbi:MAG: Eco57I restriction-modification methylase domain-containing protein [Candidatus Helarchaeota archaeon]
MVGRKDLEQLSSLQDVVNIFKELGFDKEYELQENHVMIQIDDPVAFLTVIALDAGADINEIIREYFKQDHILYLLLTDFNRFTFVKKELYPRIKYIRFVFKKGEIGRTTIDNFNNLEYGNIGTFEDLFELKVIINAFYNEYQLILKKLIETIKGIPNEEETKFFAQILLNRVMFIYFLQKKGFLKGDIDYLSNRLDESSPNSYFQFFSRLCFEGLGRDTQKSTEFDGIPYLNGGLFRQSEIEKKYKVVLSNEIFQEILNFFGKWRWYVDEHTDYLEDNQINPEILGHIFEKTINQKQTGAVYTPKEVTQYLSEKTVASFILKRFKDKKIEIEDFEKIFDNKSHLLELYQMIRHIKICDNACGSGAFLLAVERFIMELYVHIFQTMQQNGSIKDVDPAEMNFGGQPLEIEGDLTPIQEYYIKKEIIAKNLYGVDIDAGAIEICKLRMWLSLISPINNVSDLEPLPNIDYNIMCGNTLIGYVSVSDLAPLRTFFGKTPLKEKINHISELKQQYRFSKDSKIMENLKKEIDANTNQIRTELDKLLFDFFKSKLIRHGKIELKKEIFSELAPFHWVLEFCEIFFEFGGFDIVIGNPPYINTRQLSKVPNGNLLKMMWKLKPYESAYGNYDICVLFIERSHELLAQRNGTLGYIITNKFLVTDYGEKIREFILDKFGIMEIIDISIFPVFQGKSVYPIVMTLSTFNKSRDMRITGILKSYLEFKKREFTPVIMPKRVFSLFHKKVFAIHITNETLPIILKMLENSIFIVESTMQCGITGYNHAKVGRHLTDIKPKAPHWKFIVSGNITPFKITWGISVKYEKTWEHPYLIESDDISKGKKKLYSIKPKVILRGMATRLTAAVDNVGYALGTQVFAVTDKAINPYYLSGLFNSEILNFFYNSLYKSKHLQGGFIGYNEGQLLSLPIKPFKKGKKYERIVEIAKYLEKKDNPALLRELNDLVFEIYGLEPSQRCPVLGSQELKKPP